MPGQRITRTTVPTTTSYISTTGRALRPVFPPGPLQRLAYSMPEVAEMLGCSYCHVRNMVRTGELPSRRLGRRIFILVADLDALLNTKSGPRRS